MRDRSLSSALLVPIPSFAKSVGCQILLLPDSSLCVRCSHHHVMYVQRFEASSRTERGRCGLSLLKAMMRRWRSCEVRKHRSQAGGEAVTFLRNYAHLLACQLRQLVYVRLPGT